MATTSQILNRTLQHQVGIERAKAGEVKRIKKILGKVDNDILAAILSLPENYTKRDIDSLIVTIDGLTSSFYSRTVQSAFNEIAETVVSFETDFAFTTVDEFLDGDEPAQEVSKQGVLTKVNNTKYQGKTLEVWNQKLAIDKAKRIERQIKIATVAGDPPEKIATSAKRGIRASNNNSQSVTAAYFNQASNISRDEVYSQNDSRVKQIVWSSILDSGTTITCGVRSNKRYDAKTKAPIDHNNQWKEGPGKIHFGCRSVPVPIDAEGVITSGPGADFKYSEGSKTAIGADENYERGDNLKKDGKRFKIPTKNNELQKEVVSANLDYEDWLRSQPREFVEDAIGVNKAERFLDQGLSLNTFVVPSGRELSVKQLNKKLGAI